MNLRAACREAGKTCAVLLDTKGPEIRTGMLVDGKAVALELGAKLTLTTDYGHLGTAERVAVSYKHLARDMAVGGRILMADGAVLLQVESIDRPHGLVHCVCLNAAKL